MLVMLSVMVTFKSSVFVFLANSFSDIVSITGAALIGVGSAGTLSGTLYPSASILKLCIKKELARSNIKNLLMYS